VLLVSHDRVFLDRIVTSTPAFEGGGRVTEYVGGYEDYVRMRAPVSASERETPASERPKPVAAAPADTVASRRKRTFNEEREYAALPARVEALETEYQRLQAEAASPEFYKSPREHIESVLARTEAVALELEGALERWIELEAITR
jgi:ATP-binding cassette subfamily F protein uup